MSNKHWCMPNYPALKRFKRDARWAKETAGLSDSATLDFIFSQIHKAKDGQLKTRNIGEHDKVQSTILASIVVERQLLEDKTPCLFISSRELANFLHQSHYSQDLQMSAIKSVPLRWFVFPTMQIDGYDLRPVAFGKVRFYDQFAGNAVYISMPNGLVASRYFQDAMCEQALHSNLSKEVVASRADNPMLLVAVSRMMTRLCLAACVYETAFPDYIVDGLPEYISSPSIHKPKKLIAAPEILEGATRTSVSMHIRAGHFKTLQHERFKRNEDGTPKIIFVRQTVVAGKLTPKTAVGL